MTDYATTAITTGSSPSSPGLMDIPYLQRVPLDFTEEVEALGDPKTPAASGSAGPRSNVGLVFP